MTVKLKAKGPWWELSPYIRNREPFTTHGNLWGSLGPARGYNWATTGQLPDECKPSYFAADYAVYSYGTPIAWHNQTGWTMPDEKYSTTTSAHQSKVRVCLANVAADRYEDPWDGYDDLGDIPPNAGSAS